MTSVSPGRERTDFVGVTSTFQKGSVPRALYDEVLATTGGAWVGVAVLPVPIVIGTLGYGDAVGLVALSFVPQDVIRRSARMERMIFCIGVF
jgi:hypothetical protein